MKVTYSGGYQAIRLPSLEVPRGCIRTSNLRRRFETRARTIQILSARKIKDAAVAAPSTSSEILHESIGDEWSAAIRLRITF
jgi:hypothetical protein